MPGHLHRKSAEIDGRRQHLQARIPFEDPAYETGQRRTIICDGKHLGHGEEVCGEVAGIIAGDSRTSDINLTAGEPQRSIRVEVNQIEARALGVSSQSVASEIARTIAGASITSVRDGNRMIEVVIRGRPAERSSVRAIEDLHFRAASGASMPLRPDRSGVIRHGPRGGHSGALLHRTLPRGGVLGVGIVFARLEEKNWVYALDARQEWSALGLG